MASWKPVEGNLMTDWASKVNPDTPLPEYPRPQMVRADWLNLNGLWEYKITPKNMTEKRLGAFNGQILVPYAIESALSGVKRKVLPHEKLWYRRSLSIPEKWGEKRILLHFGAVDWHSKLWINGRFVGEHYGGDVPFHFDITDYLFENNSQENLILISVWDPTNYGMQEHGKQRLNPRGIYYTAVTGIWQTVWLEAVSNIYIKQINLKPDIDNSCVKVYIDTITHENSVNQPVAEEPSSILAKISISLNQEEILSTPITVNEDHSLSIENPQLWSPDNPELYDVSIVLLIGDRVIDTIQTYFGMRKISIKPDENEVQRICLNNIPLFQYGPLDQGWWPDGLYTAPTDEALRWDIEKTKEMGFNMIRKHVKIEPARWYYHCDKIGIMVWQDMPSGGNYNYPKKHFLRRFAKFDQKGRRKQAIKTQYYYELGEMLTNIGHFPSIVVWVPFNEGWGQFQTEKVTHFIKSNDPERLIDSASGWTDYGTGDIHSIHSYPKPKIPELEMTRAVALSEFGGLDLAVEGHLWQTQAKKKGYQTVKTKDELQHEYQKLIDLLVPLVKKGLSAGIYTQTTDVEQEINGLITYDRKEYKISPLILHSLHRQLYDK
jgi:beta-galactosidase/beta-glucuronidase